MFILLKAFYLAEEPSPIKPMLPIMYKKEFKCNDIFKVTSNAILEVLSLFG